MTTNDGPYAPKKLSIACGQNKPAGFKGIDLAGDADIRHDLFQFPWPIKTSSVQEVECSHFVEHIPHYIPGVAKDGFFAFFEEVRRICKNGATVNIVHPYLLSERAFWDPTHIRYIPAMTWHYLNPEWRAMNRLDHYDTDADFEIITLSYSGMSDDFMARNDQQQQFQSAHYWNVIADLHVVLKCRK